MDFDSIRAAQRRTDSHLEKTRLECIRIPGISRHLYLKLENEQVTGSFKARGSLNKILSLTDTEAKRGVVTASTGNHGLGVANACRIAQIDGAIYLPRSTISAKRQRLEETGIRLRYFDGTSLETELHAKRVALENGNVWISPYNDPDVVAGQGTVGLEILEQLPEVDRIFVTVGGGGLISGIAVAAKALKPSVRIIGCQPENSPEMYLSVKAGRVVQLDSARPTLSDGSAGGVENGSITFPMCRRLVDEWTLVSEKDIARAMAMIHAETGWRIEGSAGVAVAAAVNSSNADRTDVVVICGGNIAPEKFREIIQDAG